MPRILHFGFKFVWLISALAFGFFARDAYKSQSILLPRYQLPPDPPGIISRNSIGGLDFRTVLGNIAETHNRSVAELEMSIHQSASLSFRLNLMCCAAALIGFVTQFGQYRHDEAQKANRKRGATQPDSHPPVLIPSPQDSESKREDTKDAQRCSE